MGHPPQCVAGEGVFLVTHAVVASVNKEKEGGKGERENKRGSEVKMEMAVAGLVEVTV